jgi:hypothetical protein
VQGQQEAAAVGVELNGHFVEGQRHLEQNTHTHAPPRGKVRASKEVIKTTKRGETVNRISRKQYFF